MTPSLETPLNKELTAFLEKHGLDAALATLKRLNIASLQVLKIEMAPPRDTRLKKEFKYDKIQASWTVLEGLRAEIDSAIAESKVNYRILNEPGVKALHEFLVKNGLGNLKILEGLLNSKVESQEGLRELGTRKADWKELRDRITSAGLATAFAFDKLLQTETQKEDLKQLTDFLTSRSLNSPDIVKVFEDNGITSMNQLSHLRKDDAKWEEFKKKVAPAANEAQLADLNKIDVEHISMAVDEVKNPDPTGRTQAQKRREELKEALAAVSDLREKVGKKAGEAGAVSLDDAKKAFNSLVEKLSKNQYLDLSFTNAADAKNQDDLLKLFKVAETDVKFVDAELKKVAETPSLTLNELIERTDLKKGFLLRCDSIGPSQYQSVIRCNNDLVQFLLSGEARKTVGKSSDVTLRYSSSRTRSVANASYREFGATFATAVQVEGVAFTGSGIGAMSVAADYATSRVESDAESSQRTTSVAERGEVRSIFHPRARFDFRREGDALFSLGATNKLKEIAALGGKRQLETIQEFYIAFGSHCFLAITLGGRYEFVARGTSRTEQGKGSLEAVVSKSMNWAVQAAASYQSIGGAVSAAGSMISKETKAEANAGAYNALAADSEVSISVEKLGGAQGSLPIDAWGVSLGYNSTWEVIKRDGVLPVWELIRLNKAIPDGEALARLFEKVWVQEIFPGPGHETVYPGLKQSLAKDGIETEDALKRYLVNYKGSPKHETLDVSLRIVTATGGPGSRAVATARLQVTGAKLIGGGAATSHSGNGVMLTASHPTDDYAAWEARLKDHEYPDNTGRITAYAIYLMDPSDEWDVGHHSFTSDPQKPTPTVTAILPEGYQLTGGGARANSTEQLLTASYPDWGKVKGWVAASKEHNLPAPGTVTAWVLGIKPRNPLKTAPEIAWMTETVANADQNEARGAAAPAEGYRLIGGGSKATWETEGSLLTQSYPDFARNKWVAAARRHVRTNLVGVVGYALYAKSSPPLAAKRPEWTIEVREKGNWGEPQGCNIHCDPPGDGRQWKLIGGGAKAQHHNWQGRYLSACFPERNGWTAATQQYSELEREGSVTAHAFYLLDPDDTWDVIIVQEDSNSDEQHSTVRATLPRGYVLTGGGAQALGDRRMLTGSYPDPDGKSWVAKCMQWQGTDKGKVRAWVIGVRPNDPWRTPAADVKISRIEGSARGDWLTRLQVPAADGRRLIGGGANVRWRGQGAMLTASYPDANNWAAEAKYVSMGDPFELETFTISI